MRGVCLRGNPGAVSRMRWKLILRGKTIDILWNELGGGRQWRVQRGFMRASLWLNQSFSTNQVCFPNQDIIERWSRIVNFSVSKASIPGFWFLKTHISRSKFKFYWLLMRTSLVAQMVGNESSFSVRSLGQEDPLVKGMLPTPVFLLGEFHGQRSLTGSSSWGPKSQTLLSD